VSGGARALIRTGLYLAVLLVYLLAASLVLLAPLSVIPGADTQDLGRAGGNGLVLLGVVVPMSLGALALTHVFLRRLDRENWRALLLRGRALIGLLKGYGIALVFLGILAVIMTLAGWLHFDGPGELLSRGAARSLGIILFFIIGFLIQGGTEEAICRGYVLRNLHIGLGFPAALALSSAIFGIGHGLNPGATSLAFLNIFVIGILFALLTVRGSLWIAVGMHGGWNLFLALAGIPVSGARLDGLVRARLEGSSTWTGGDFGPEGSALTLILSLIGCAIVWFRPGTKAALARAREIHFNEARIQRVPSDGLPHPEDDAAPTDSGPDPRPST
jgi:membrane protease YdiL (CAAX protease family)